MTGPWCLSLRSGETTWHATREDAEAAAVGKGESLIWHDGFDYERYNRGSVA